MRPLLTLPLGELGARVASAPRRTLTEARALLDRPLDLDRDPPLHRQRDLSLSLSLPDYDLRYRDSCVLRSCVL